MIAEPSTVAPPPALPVKSAAIPVEMTAIPCAASRIKRRRSTAELETIYTAIYRIAEADHPMTLRGLFYRLVAEGLIPKAENEYEKVGRYLLKLRREGRVPYQWIADNTRWMRKPRTYSSAEAALHETARTYRRALWSNQDAYVEIWCEKDTLAGVLYETTEAWDVPLMVVRGFSSETYLYEAAGAIDQSAKPAFLYLLTDHDPAGVGIATHIEERLRQFLPDAPITVDRVAVTEEQIVLWNLPTRPTKTGDSRGKAFAGESVELDAIPPATLRSLVEACIERHVDPSALRWTRQIEDLERQSLTDLVNGGLSV